MVKEADRGDSEPAQVVVRESPPALALKVRVQAIVVCPRSTGSVPKPVEKERGASSGVIAPRIGFHRSPHSHDLEVA